MIDYLKIIGREREMFEDDYRKNHSEISEKIGLSKILVIGGAGSIGRSVVIELFKLNPLLLHVVDINENMLVELVRTIRSKLGYKSGEFKTFAIDCGGVEFRSMLSQQDFKYDYVFNFSALKHVRSERDQFTLMRMVQVNILNSIDVLNNVYSKNLKNYFCVSTDKAANPVNMMGASKRIMEKMLMRESERTNISMARFANVAFSDGSLLHGFKQRIENNEPLSAPIDVKRYFVTFRESAILCLMSGILGENRQIYFPKLTIDEHLNGFHELAIRYLNSIGYEPFECESEEEARHAIYKKLPQGKWPCYFFKSDTTGEKPYEEFYTLDEDIIMDKFNEIGIVSPKLNYDSIKLDAFKNSIIYMLEKGVWNKAEIVNQFNNIIPEFKYIDLGKSLDEKM